MKTVDAYHVTKSLPRVGILLVLAATLILAGCGGGGGAAEGNALIIKESQNSFDDTIAKLTSAIRNANLVLVKEINYQQMLKMVEMDVPGTKGFEIFHPRYGKVVFSADPRAGIEVPLRVQVLERGGKTTVQYIRPSARLGQYNGLGDLGKELDTVFDQLTTASTQ